MFGTHFYISRWPPWPTEGKLQDVPFKKNYYLKNKDLFFFLHPLTKRLNKHHEVITAFPGMHPKTCFPGR